MNAPEKCPKCEADLAYKDHPIVGLHKMACGTVIGSNGHDESPQCVLNQRDALAAELKDLRRIIAESAVEIEQRCGQALGYPWYKDDQKNFPGATEKDGVCIGEHVTETIVHELANRYTALLARVKRLEEAGDKLIVAIWSVQDWGGSYVGECCDELEKAFETNP